MEKNVDNPGQEKLKIWIKSQLDAAVQKLIKHGTVDSLIIEAKPAWVLPFQILIGKIRDQGHPDEFEWFICGEVPLDYLESTVASTPREAARHFAMKWQLGAVRYEELEDPESPGETTEASRQDAVDQLVEKAEALYALADDTRLWLQDNN
jgi:hypothetical protein